MKVFLTYNDQYNGIYKTQVIDVLKMYQSEGIKFKLISFISLKDFFKQKKQISENYHDALILPMIPKIKNWHLNRFILKFFLKRADLIIARGIFATNLALLSKKKSAKVIYNGRGAIYSEQLEYGVYDGTRIEGDIFQIEKKAVLNSDKRISISESLINYWKENFDYKDTFHEVIPCCTSFFSNTKKIIFKENSEIKIIFSGSSAKWQSYEIMCKHFSNFLSLNANLSIIILSKNRKVFSNIVKRYPNRIKVMWINHKDVKDVLLTADYGYVYRDKTETNLVSSPVKIAEYLSCGLKLLISDSLGDYFKMSILNNLGINLDDKNFNFFDLKKVSMSEKKRISKFAQKNLSLESKIIKQKYLRILDENSFSY